MITQRVAYSQAASTTTPNILSGVGIEYIGKASNIDIYAAAFLAGALDTIALSQTVGGNSQIVVPAGSGINVNAAGPQVAFDGLGTYPIPAGAHLVLALTSDATAGTHTGNFMFVVTP